MDFKQRLSDLLVQNNHSQAELARFVGVKNNTVNDWINKGTSPKIENLYRIAEFFDISFDNLFTNTETSSNSLSADEVELLKYYNQLPVNEKNRLIGRAEAMAEMYAEATPEPVPTMIVIKHSVYSVSAGTGDMLDTDEWDTIDVPDSPEARKADFCLTIHGNSMEPVYYNGDIVLVKEQQSVEKGQIGIFIIEGCGYIKKFGGDRLISLNEEYDDILLSDYDPEDIRCSGLVIGRV